MKPREFSEKELLDSYQSWDWPSKKCMVRAQPYKKEHSVVLAGEIDPTVISWIVIAATAENGRVSEKNIRFLGAEPEDLRFKIPEPSLVSIYNFQYGSQLEGFGILSTPDNSFGLELTHYTPPEGKLASCTLNGLVVIENVYV